ncbi:hypothetical protein Pcinc_035394 [Petrolisthes cinctipes]|uniref:Amino acid transporter transmembrane domain-containing protein n=1 Tax=Petrolisthes cinctipes TaxID=88211 RepID=A0AAE1EPF8_PETCI|nr:hypothetical protein Pcinc_035394 [Petrolisthes cinctipes]
MKIRHNAIHPLAVDLSSLQKDIGNISRVAASWGLNFNPNKCVVIRCQRGSVDWTAVGSLQYYHLDNSDLSLADNHRDLGILVDNTLKFHVHIRATVNKAAGLANNLLKSTLCRCSNFMVTILKSHIRPILEFGSTVWNTGYLGDLGLLESVQRRWTKHIDGLADLSYTNRLKALNLPTPEDSISPQSSSHYTLVDDDVALLPSNAADASGRLRHHQDLFASCQLTSSSGGYYVGISWYKAVFLIVNAALGAGLLNFPRAFYEAGGIMSGNLVHIIFTTMALGSLIIIAKCSSEYDCATYQELLLRACGQKWGVLGSVFISIYCFITCVTFIIIIGDQFDRVFASYIGSSFCHHWYLNRQFTMSISSILLIFPSCYKRIDGLRFMSYVGVLSIWYLTAVIVTEYYRGNYERGPVVVVGAHWEQVFNVVPTICFGYQCHVSSVPIYSCLQQREAAVSIKACIVAVITCLIVYTISANYGYLTFGSLVGGDVLTSYDATKPHVLIAILLLAIKSWTTYPLLLFCVREAIGDLYIQMKSLTPDRASHSEPTRRKVIAVLLWIMSILMAVFTPNINIVVKLLGSLAAFFIFVFPGLCLMELVIIGSQTTTTTLTTSDVCLLFTSFVYITLGMFAFGLAFTLGIQSILNPVSTHQLCT